MSSSRKRVKFSSKSPTELSRFSALERRRGGERKCFQVAVDCLQDARIAIDAGVDSLILCSSLTDDNIGLTPTVGLLLAVGALPKPSKLQLYCMIRCRHEYCNGQHHEYCNDEITVMLYDIDQLRLAGANGFVFGAMNSEGFVNVENCNRVKHAARGLPITFIYDLNKHSDWPSVMLVVRELEFQRILVNYLSNKNDFDVLADMVVASNDNPRIIVGNVRSKNISKLIERTHAIEFQAVGNFEKNQILSIADCIHDECKLMK